MNNEVLLELAARWEQDAITPEVQDGSKESEIANAVNEGRRIGIRDSADILRMLVKILG